MFLKWECQLHECNTNISPKFIDITIYDFIEKNPNLFLSFQWKEIQIMEVYKYKEKKIVDFCSRVLLIFPLILFDLNTF